MEEVNTIGLDIAKSVFQVHGIDSAGQVVVRRQLRRGEVLKFFQKLPPCVVGMEACASSHYWGREIAALGHDVRLMPPTRVKPYVKWGKKNDQVDAAACCEAVQRPCMQFVPIKTPDQQAALLLHRARKMLVNQRTQLGNAIRAHLAEFGIVTAKGEGGVSALLAMVSNPEDKLVPAAIRPILAILVEHWRAGDARIAALDRQIAAWHKSHDDSRRVATIPQIGPIVASALAATAGDAARFKNGRQFAAWLGLVPSQNSTGGKERLGRITKTGDTYVRQLLVVAAIGMIRRVRVNPAISPWFAQLLARKTPKQAAVALANKMARMAWAILAKGGVYKAPDLATAAEAA
jgi:transposase